MKWAKLAARIGDAIPFLGLIVNSEELQRRTASLTFSSQRLRDALPEFRFTTRQPW